MRPVRGAESIVHIKITELGKRLGEFWIVRFLTWLKPNILEQGDIAILHVLNDFLRHVTSSIVAKNDRLMNQRMQIFADWPKRIFLCWFSFGPAKMRHQNYFRAVLAQVIDGRQAFADPSVISHANFAVADFSRHVEVHSHEHPFSTDVEITESEFRHF